MPKSTPNESEAFVEEVKEVVEVAAETTAEALAEEVRAEATETAEKSAKPKRKYTRKAKKETTEVKAEDKPKRGRPRKNVAEKAAAKAAKLPSRRKAAVVKEEPVKSAEVAPEFYIQEDGLDISYADVIAKVKQVVTGDYSSLKIYLNLKEKRVYAVVDNKINVNFPLE